jgi:hypothetical protein
MPKFYATHDSDGLYITENANIVAFNNRDAAVAYLLQSYDPKWWDHASAVVEPGSFGDCWIKSQKPPAVGESWITPFSRSQLRVERPGQHPGGKRYWTTPAVDVLVVSRIDEIDQQGEAA